MGGGWSSRRGAGESEIVLGSDPLLRMMRTCKLTTADATGFYQAFTAMDADLSGEVSLSEFADFFGIVAPVGDPNAESKPPELLKRVFSLMDHCPDSSTAPAHRRRPLTVRRGA